ncbi:ATP-binding cassette sub-family G member 4-like [Uranotaenia lowii]|uniref:ATP-binding cassette sub-family G member 4-like n=1 Tax=Uranotaenia lowii TaxID=190385 RepID=UPI00247966FC|nr:ATP-binding cassette sub-family G member 4-like [Uranotaenia lowii]XP_055598769.1 ATP-binding cassette sub-family G member 4-like [Uranotaenia lowii]XP_055598770.1 ATP-binding cassette sub-family G member 4-like [Uranotaenia lowii]
MAEVLELETVDGQRSRLLNNMALEFSNICFKGELKNDKRKVILENVSGTFAPGRLTAIMGPSGSGKSSLLNILSGFKKHGVIGSVMINGDSLTEETFRNKCVYIQQDCDMLEHLTAQETLDYASELKMPSHISSMVRKKKVNDILEILGLRHTMTTLVRNLSGGEKKRLSIGIELITNPPIILLDEPTSGLDSVSAMQLVSYIKMLAAEGRTVVCVIHQPASNLFRLFDDLFLLSAGKCIYAGPIEGMVATFGEAGFHCPKFYNRADFALEVASMPSCPGQELLALRFNNSAAFSKQRKSVNGDQNHQQPSPYRNNCLTIQTGSHRRHYPVSQWKQFTVLLRRSIRSSTRDFFFAQLRVIAHICVGFLLGLVFYGMGKDASTVMTNSAGIFFFHVFIFFGNSMPCTITFPMEAKIFVREHLNNWYSLEAYYVAKLFADLPLQFICPTVFLTIAYLLTGQPLELFRFSMFWSICLLLGMFAQSVGLLSGAAFDIQMATFFVPCLTIPALLFSGFFIKSYELLDFLKPVSYLSFFRYSSQGSLQAIYGYNRTDYPCSEIMCYYNRPSKFLKFMDTPETGFEVNVYCLLGFIAFFQILLYISLRRRLKIFN